MKTSVIAMMCVSGVLLAATGCGADGSNDDTGTIGDVAEAGGDTPDQPDTGGPAEECPGGCDDGQPCTNDVCQSGECVHVWSGASDCQPTLAIAAPERAQMMDYAAEVDVSGAYSSPGDSVQRFLFLGQDVTPPAPAFSLPMPTAHGLNIAAARVEDRSGQAQAARSFLMSRSWVPVPGGMTDASVKDGLVVRLGPELIDDDDPDVDDLAAIAAQVMEGMLLYNAAPDALTADGAASLLWCEWTVEIPASAHHVSNVDITPVKGGLEVSVSFTDISITFSAVAPDIGCPDAGGTVTAKSATVSAKVGIALDADGTFTIDVPKEDVEVTVDALKFDLTEGSAATFDFLLNWFDGVVADLIGSAVKSIMVDEMVPLVAQMLDGVSGWSRTFEIPPLFGVDVGLQATVAVKPTSLAIDSSGIVVGLSMLTTAPKGAVPLVARGSLARGGCFDGQEAPAALPDGAPFSMALHDDVLNQALFAAWWGGAMHRTIDAEALAGLGLDLPISDLAVTLAPSLPPVLTDCDGGKLKLEIGDLRIDASFTMDGVPGQAAMWVSGIVAVDVGTAPSADGAIALTLRIAEIEDLSAEVTDAAGTIGGGAGVLDAAAANLMEKLVLEGVGVELFKAFPVPRFDIHKDVQGSLTGATFSFSPTGVSRAAGRTVMTGKLGE